ncbi:ankyrin repeat-containing domain protein [Aspergillus crustosus]
MSHTGEENTARKSLSLGTNPGAFSDSYPPKWACAPKWGYRPLFIAATRGNTRVIRILQEFGVDINAKDTCGRTAFMLASGNGMTGTVRVLLGDKRVNLNIRTRTEGDALYAACRRGDEKLVRMTPRYGKGRANVNTRATRLGPTALITASINGNEKIVRLLLDAGADANALCADPNSQAGWLGHVLQAAASLGYVNMVKLLLNKKADINAKGGYYGNALCAAAYKRDLKIVQILLDAGADIDPPEGKMAATRADKALITERLKTTTTALQKFD